MIHLDLFSGIGGFAYAIDQVWDNTEHIFCEIDPFCQQVLKKHWPEAQIYGDIRQFNPNTHGSGLEGQQHKPHAKRQSGRSHRKGQDQESRPFIVTGGFPCQSFSQAGLRRGTDDIRWLWPEMFEIIRLTQPTWVIAENVSGLLTWKEGVAFEQVCTDLEAEGYEVQPLIIPAAAVNAPHRRDRIWFVAHAKSTDDSRRPEKVSGSHGRPKLHNVSKRCDTDRIHAGNANQQRLERPWPEQQAGRPRQADSPPDWSKDWHEVATELCSVDDGLPAELDGFKLSKSAHRKEQLKAYGNAIVPQVAVELLKAISYEGVAV